MNYRRKLLWLFLKLILMIRCLLLLIFFISNVSASEVLNITFLGTGTPRPNLSKLGPSILIKNKTEEILLDVGRGVTLRLNQVGNDYSKINNIYISHLHYDHIVGLADFWLTSNLWQKKTDTNIYGPNGIRDFCSGIEKSYLKDIEYRYKKNKYSKIKCYNFREIFNNKKSTLEVISFKNSHGHVDSYGFKIISGDKIIVYSGDTTFSDNVIKNSKNSDILIHEIIASSDKLFKNNKKLQQVTSTHTTISQLIRVLDIAKPKLTILNHALLFGVSENKVLSEIKKKYNGKVIFAEDLMSIDLGNEINIFNIGK